MEFQNVIETRDQLREIVPEPAPTSRAALKDIDHIDALCRRFIAASPFLIMATKGADGLFDLSPKGDPAGFVHVLDEKTLVIPDRVGNNRLDTFQNLLDDPAIGLIFLVPGNGMTLRVSGKARLVADPQLCQRFVIKGKAPKLVLVIEVQHAFTHCTKCMARSNLWQPEGWPDLDDVPTMAEAMAAHAKSFESRGQTAPAIDMGALDRLY
ncbi:MAG: MSMEG_1061 family FMN-dependent PPOX-type flavoprotein [Pseudomonadota bacterium]